MLKPCLSLSNGVKSLFGEAAFTPPQAGGSQVPTPVSGVGFCGGGNTSLDIVSTNDRWTRRQRRFYHRVMSGIEMACYQGVQLRVLCLTSSPQSGDIVSAFRKFVKRVRRKYGRFEYIVARELTQSGLVHLHIVYKGAYMSQTWLSRVWDELNNAKIVYVCKFRGGKRRLGAYLCKYLCKQLAGSRSWWSWSWVFKGFVRVWRYIVSRYRQRAVNAWLRLLRYHANASDFAQLCLDTFK